MEEGLRGSPRIRIAMRIEEEKVTNIAATLTFDYR